MILRFIIAIFIFITILLLIPIIRFRWLAWRIKRMARKYKNNPELYKQLNEVAEGLKDLALHGEQE